MKQPRISGLYAFHAAVFTDNRGSFVKPMVGDVFHPDSWAFQPKQLVYTTDNPKGAVRGLHWQKEPFMERKLVTCVHGQVAVMVVNMRSTSHTFKRVAVHLLSPGKDTLLVPAGCAHGYQSLEDGSIVVYMSSNEYAPDYERGISPLDPLVVHMWPLAPSIVSEKDRKWPRIK